MNPFDLEPDPVNDDPAYQLGEYVGYHWALEEFGHPGLEEVAVWKVLNLLPAYVHNLGAAQEPESRSWRVPDLLELVGRRDCKTHNITAANRQDPLFVHGFICGAVQVFGEMMEAIRDHMARRRGSLFEAQEFQGELPQRAAPASLRGS